MSSITSIKTINNEINNIKPNKARKQNDLLAEIANEIFLLSGKRLQENHAILEESIKILKSMQAEQGKFLFSTFIIPQEKKKEGLFTTFTIGPKKMHMYFSELAGELCLLSQKAFSSHEKMLSETLARFKQLSDTKAKENKNSFPLLLHKESSFEFVTYPGFSFVKIGSNFNKNIGR